MANRWGNNGNSDRLYFGVPKSLQMVTAAMKLKDIPWKKSYDKPRQHIKSRDITLPTMVRQIRSVTQSCPTLCNPMNRSTPGLPVHHELPFFTQTHVHRVSVPSNYLILCRPLLLLPSVFPSIRVFSNESVLHIRWPEYWRFSFSISPSNEYLGLTCLIAL